MIIIARHLAKYYEFIRNLRDSLYKRLVNEDKSSSFIEMIKLRTLVQEVHNVDCRTSVASFYGKIFHFNDKV